MLENVEAFLTQIEEKEIIEAIRLAESNTSGEIRIHIENTSNGNVDKRALEVFSILKMDNTELHNAVLIYVAVKDHTFAIYGDKGINDLVPNTFWNNTKDIIETHFKNQNFKQGLVDGVLHAGEQLKTHFPIGKKDKDELSNTISKG